MPRSTSARALASLTLVSFVTGLLPHTARAQDDVRRPVAEERTATPARPEEDVERGQDVEATGSDTSNEFPAPRPFERGEPLLEHPVSPPPSPAGVTPASLPTGADMTGVSSQVLALPQGAGKVQGMGESFSNQLSTGTGAFSIPITLPGARGAADPSLGLSYSTATGHGVAGVGWDIGVPFIARQTDRGSPQYDDPPNGAWAPTQDRFVFNGGQELVPICQVTNGSCFGAQPGEAMPAWANQWQYFRPRVEGNFLRFFWSPDHRTWRAQDKTGVSLELGAPLDGTLPAGTTETNPGAPGPIYRWNLSRQYDAYGLANPSSGATPLPVNVTRYAYTVDRGTSYVTDIYDTPPAANAATADVSSYAHHTHLVYGARTDVTTSYRRGWAASQGLRLIGIDVTSKTSNEGPSGARRLVRRYHLTYDPSYHVSLLTRVQVEGRCGAPADGEEGEPVTEDALGNLPSTTACPTLPAMTLGYTHVTPYHTDGSSGVADLAGYEGFDERVTTMTDSPPHSVDEQDTDLFDVNADGLPDVVVTMPGLYGGQHGLYLNSSETGEPNSFSATTMGVQGVLGENTTTIQLDNPNLSTGDIDGDGKIDLIHMPQVKSYSVYTPEQQGAGWVWQGRAVTTAAAQSPKINLGNDGLDIQRMDVNGDGLVDVVLSTGTEMETFYSLDRFPGGDGQFGHASWTGAASAALSNDPVASCVPTDGLPVQFSDATIKLADMNGDGLPDIVRMQQGDIHYWPGRGDGYWGTGTPSACAGGTFEQDKYVSMGQGPEFQDPNGSALRLDDVNGDGLDDAVEVNATEVNVWINVDGTRWTGPHVIQNAPESPAYQSRVRVVDMNGSGTRDILWGDAGAYKFMDLSGGARPWMLTHVDNGLGLSTDLAFASSVSLMLGAERANAPWASVTPGPMTVVTQMTVSDHLPVAGSAAGTYVTQYTYRDPVYDGIQREFRGFTSAVERHVGDTNSPSSSAESRFLLGVCEDDEPQDGLPSPCTFQGRWRDNRREALKGLPLSVQSFDDQGNYLSSTHQTYRLRKLYTGLDGREVRHAYASAKDTYLYDTAGGDHTASTVTTSDVELETAPPAYSTSEYLTFPSPVAAEQTGVLSLYGVSGRVHLQTKSDVDVFGNTFHAIDGGCVEGCAPADVVIVQHAQSDEVSGDTGWLWRETHTMTMGANEAQARDEQTRSYDSAGSPLYTYRYLTGNVALPRVSVGAGPIPPQPQRASGGGWIASLASTYDPFGNVLSSVAPNARCHATSFDADYAALPTTDTVYVGAAGPTCGSVPLIATATYDRGFGVVKSMTNVHQEETTANYDGFGRVVEIFTPDPATGQPGALPSTLVDYELPADPTSTPYSRVHTETQDGADPTFASYQEKWAYVDGLGRTRVTLDQADVAAGDAAPWVASDLSVYDAKGGKQQEYLPFFYAGDPSAFPLATGAPAGSYARTEYDAFGRTAKTFNLDGTIALSNRFHALSADAWDAADLGSGPHAGSYASSAKDGHGREISSTERNHVGGVLQAYVTTKTFLSTGEPIGVTRTNLATGATVVRSMTYDSLGRMVTNREPDSGAASGNAAWWYAYDDNGDLVGMADARACGANYSYDAGGRILGEDYAPCTGDQAPYTAPSGTTGYEVTYLYDVPDPALQGVGVSGANPQWYAGQLSSVADRAGKNVRGYDGRGRQTAIARQLAAPSGAFAPRWYVELSTYDAADRVVTEQTGAVDPGGVLEVTSATTTSFSKRSLVESVTSDHGPLIAGVVHDADTLPLAVNYADLAGTTTTTTYTARRQPLTVHTSRNALGLWSAPTGTYEAPASGAPSTLQLDLENLTYAYDEVDNPTSILDGRSPSEWPAGAQPVSRVMQYDDSYRLTELDYQYPGGTDTWVSPFAAEDQGLDASPQRAAPAPHVSFATRARVQTYAYDWLGNATSSSDDAGGFYDRSLGTITNGTSAAGPYQLRSAVSTGGASPGTLSAIYDAAGNTTGLSVARAGSCLPSSATCSSTYIYSWDEVGRLARARRWDIASPGTPVGPPAGSPAADLAYTYDATDDRAIKSATDEAGNIEYTLYPLDALEVRRTTWDSTLGDYDRGPATDAPYLFAHGVRIGRIELADVNDPSLSSGAAHVFLELPDHLGSTSSVVDRDTGELVEASTYMAYGDAESDYRPARWSSFREDYRFTGKEEDVEVGIAYFGKRYLAPALGRWLSPDPLEIHKPGSADLNVYAYVHGRTFAATDPTGLVEDGSDAQNRSSGEAQAQGGGAGSAETPSIADRLQSAATRMLNAFRSGAASRANESGAATRTDDDAPVSLPHMSVDDDGNYEVIRPGYALEHLKPAVDSAAQAPPVPSSANLDGASPAYRRAALIMAQNYGYNQHDRNHEIPGANDGVKVRHDCSGTSGYILFQKGLMTTEDFYNDGKGLPGYVATTDTKHFVEGEYVYFPLEGTAKYAHVTVIVKDKDGKLQAWRASGDHGFGWSESVKHAIDWHINNEHQRAFYFVPVK